MSEAFRTSLQVSIGSAVYVLRSMRFQDQLSASSTLEATFLGSNVTPEMLIGEELEIQSDTEGNGPAKLREFKGFIVEASINRSSGVYGEVQIKAKSWTHFLKYSKGSEIYQKKNVEQILKASLKNIGIKGKGIQKNGTLTDLGFCVQYEETDYDFFRRTAAEQGLHWFFGAETDTSKMIIQHAQRPFAKVADDATILSDGSLSAPKTFRLEEFREIGAAQSGALELKTYDTSKAQVVSSKLTLKNFPAALKRAVNSQFKGTKAEEKSTLTATDVKNVKAEAGRETKLYIGKCYHPRLFVGQQVAINLVSAPDLSRDYYITAVTYTIDLHSDGSWQADFECIPSNSNLAPEQLPKPVLSGLHNAIVQGREKNQPVMNSDGRVKVKFAWDRGSEDSCLVRVATPLAGKSYGVNFFPREGQEVLVSFINGEPDLPVIVGSVHNGKQQPWIKSSSTLSGIKTRLDGETNTLEFDDKKGAEKITIDAGKDFNLKTANDATFKVDGAFTEEITKDSKTKAKSLTIEAETEIELKVGSSSLQITKNGVVIKTKSVKLDGDAIDLEGKNKITVSSNSIGIKSKGSLTAKGGSTVSVSSSGKLDLKGQSSTLKGNAKASVEGAMSSLGGSGITTVKGSLIKLG